MSFWFDRWHPEFQLDIFNPNADIKLKLMDFYHDGAWSFDDLLPTIGPAMPPTFLSNLSPPESYGGSRTVKFYSASFTDDLSQVVDHVSARYTKSNIYAVGWSLGANILVRFLGQESRKHALSGAVSLCNPFNLVIADEDFRKGFNNVYDKALARSLRRIFKKHALLFEGLDGEYNIPMAANARTVREFDEGLTRVSFAFTSVDDYYFNASSSRTIEHVRTPLLCIQAANDPIAPARGIPHAEIKENPHCLLIVTPQGGHLGWVSGDEAPFGAPWTDAVVMEFLEHIHEGKNTTRSSSGDENRVQQFSTSVTVHTK
ncbi:embryogenesis-associated protein EMB8-like [Asparagus officinalis]|uniref:embryogenesis-associated protein EMB8-like n=1 Tax=Asparagus officinalis TaxID=4686 RepID=UPI00098E12EC|nr:embryogenesis-associated protein EMB8-like [Asparagus officinalis]